MRIGSLFTGYGGLDMAVQTFYGGEVAWYSEIDKAANTILAAHYQNVPNLGDITTLDWASIEPVDILTGGYPCQPFSHAGLRKGKNDERHLWPFVCAAIDALRPGLVILENVRGHLTLGFGDVLADLSRVGYDARWGVVRASDAGAPHGRARIFIVAHSGDARRGEYGRTIAIKSQFHSAQYLSDIDADADGNGHGRKLHTGAVGRVEGRAEGEPRQRQRARGVADAGGVDDAADTAGTSQGRNLRERRLPLQSGRGVGIFADADQRGRDGRASDAGREPEQRAAAAGDSETDWGKYAPAITRWEQVSGRTAPEPTIPGANGRPRLAPAFVEWMMGLPAGHVTDFGLSPSTCLKMLGNGVVPQQAALALRMLEAA